jgi:hypothetical protein
MRTTARREAIRLPEAEAGGPGGVRLRPADVLGVPVLPPGRMTGMGNRLRAGLARLHRGTAPPPGRIMEAVLGGLDLAALAALCRLDLPDRLDPPMPTEDLALELRVDTRRLARLVRYAAARGWLRIDRHGCVRATRTSEFLRREHPGGWRAWVEFAAGAEVAAAIGALEGGLGADADAFESANDAPFFAWMREHPERGAAFDAAMAAGARMHGLLLARTLDWSSSRRVCDIGGGDGTLLGVLLAEHPHLEGVLLDLPEVIERSTALPHVTAVGGDAFVAVPPGCDTYLLVNVLHDWDDAAALTLLQRATTALLEADPASGGRVVVVEAEAHQRPRDDLATRADLLMLALTPGGRERTTREIQALAGTAGLRRRRTHRLASGDAAHVLVPVRLADR